MFCGVDVVISDCRLTCGVYAYEETSAKQLVRAFGISPVWDEHHATSRYRSKVIYEHLQI